MRVSVIHPDHIMGKTVTVNFVDDVCEFTNLPEFCELIMEHSITTATFTNNIWNDTYTLNESMQTRSQGLTRMWKYLANVEQTQFIVFDFDNGLPSAEVQSKVAHFRHVIAGSNSHLVDKGDGKGAIERYHLFIQLDTPVTDPKLYSIMCREFAKEYGIVSDTAVLEMSRYYYRHKAILSSNASGELLRVANFKFAFERHQAVQSIRSELPRKYSKDGKFHFRFRKIDETRYWKQTIIPKLTTVGRRHLGILPACGFLKSAGIPESEALEIISRHSTITDQGEIERSVRHAYAH